MIHVTFWQNQIPSFMLLLLSYANRVLAAASSVRKYEPPSCKHVDFLTSPTLLTLMTSIVSECEKVACVPLCHINSCLRTVSSQGMKDHIGTHPPFSFCIHPRALIFVRPGDDTSNARRGETDQVSLKGRNILKQDVSGWNDGKLQSYMSF